MILYKYLKYFWLQYLLYFAFLVVMFMFVGMHVWDLSTLYTGMHPYDYVDKERTYKLENAYMLELQNNTNTFDYPTIETLLQPFADNKDIDGFATAIACPGAVIELESNTPIYNCISYINPTADEVIKLKYIYGGWFDEDTKSPQVILGNFWADYYDAGDKITLYLGGNGEFPYTFTIAGILEQNSAPAFYGANRTGVPLAESGDERAVYFSSFDFLENTGFRYSSYITDKSIYNMLIKTSNPATVGKDFDKGIYKITYYYENVYENFFGNQIFYKAMVFSLLTIFGIIALSYTTGRKLNLLYYIFSLNGMSRRRFIFYNMIFVAIITIAALTPTFYVQFEKCRLSFENTIFRAGFLGVIAILINIIFVTIFVAISRKKLGVLYKKCLEN